MARGVSKISNLIKMTWKRLLVVVVVLALIAGGGYYAHKYDQARKDVKRLSNPQEAARAETSQLIATVGRLVELPANETPTLATVSDASKLKSQSFFANAQNGDRVLIYTQSKRAILYRPSTNKIIEIAPVNIGNNATSQPAAGQ